MPQHADTLDDRDALGRPLAGALAMHVGVAAALLMAGLAGRSARNPFGDPRGGALGAVTVNVVSSIPLPSRSGPENPVAHETESRVPTPPLPKPKAQPKVLPPPPDAIPLKSRSATRPAPAAAPPDKFRAQQKDQPNQLYSTAGQAMVSPMYQLQGGGSVGIGTNSPFGERLGWYANLLREKVGRNWKYGDVDPRVRSGQVTVTFTILRDGSVPANSVRIVQRSAVPALDFSAQRAVLDAAPFPALPPEYNRNQADVEFHFELGR